MYVITVIKNGPRLNFSSTPTMLKTFSPVQKWFISLSCCMVGGKDTYRRLCRCNFTNIASIFLSVVLFALFCKFKQVVLLFSDWCRLELASFIDLRCFSPLHWHFWSNTLACITLVMCFACFGDFFHFVTCTFLNNMVWSLYSFTMTMCWNLYWKNIPHSKNYCRMTLRVSFFTGIFSEIQYTWILSCSMMPLIQSIKFIPFQ